MTGIVDYEEGVLAIFVVDEIREIFVDLDLGSFITVFEPLVVHVELVALYKDFL